MLVSPPPPRHCENVDFEVAARDIFGLRYATCINDTNLERSYQALPRRLLFMHQKDKQHMLKCRASVSEQTLSTHFGGENIISPERVQSRFETIPYRQLFKLYKVMYRNPICFSKLRAR